MSSQSGDFSCTEITWEESSTKCKNYYGVVEEPREERIIPIKLLDRGISIHTASDEEDEPFWVVESVKKHEEVRNEIKKMKENKISQTSLTESYYEDDDNSLKELLKRVQKQRNDLEDILEKENNNSNISNAYSSKPILSRTNSFLNETSTPKAKSISRLSSLDEKIKCNELLDNETNEFNSNSSDTCTKTKEQHSLITENISKTCLTNITEKLDRSEKGVLAFNLSSDMIKNDFPLQIVNLGRNNSKVEDSKILNTVKRNSISRLSSKEENDSSFLPKKVTDEYTESPQKKSLYRVFSNEERDDSSPTTILSNECYEKPKESSLSNFSPTKDLKQKEINNDIIKRKSNPLSPVKTEESGEKYSKIKNTVDDESNKDLLQNLNDYGHISSHAENNNLNKINYIPENNLSNKTNNDNCKNINDNNNLNKSSTLQMPKPDDADCRRKSLIQESNILSDALNDICNEIPEDSNYNKQIKLSNKDDVDMKYNNSKTRNKIGIDSSKSPVELEDSAKSLSYDNVDTQDYFGKGKSNILNITPDKNNSNLKHTESDSIPKLNNEKHLIKINDELDNVPTKIPQTSNTEASKLPLDLSINQNDLRDFDNNDLKTIHFPKSRLNNADENISSNKKILHNCEPHSLPESLPKSNDLNMLSNDINELKNTDNNLCPNNFTNTSLSLNEENNENNKESPLKEHFMNKEDDLNNTELNSHETKIATINKPSSDRTNDENENELRLKTLDKQFKEKNIESSNGIKQKGGIQKIKCYNNK